MVCFYPRLPDILLQINKVADTEDGKSPMLSLGISFSYCTWMPCKLACTSTWMMPAWRETSRPARARTSDPNHLRRTGTRDHKSCWRAKDWRELENKVSRQLEFVSIIALKWNTEKSPLKVSLPCNEALWFLIRNIVTRVLKKLS